mgnify:CR=1 FL=1|jgi:TPR repeat protein
MKKLILSLNLILTLCFGSNIDDAISSYKKGDYNIALPIFQKLADKNDSLAQEYLGLMYADGLGVKIDYVKAYEYSKKSCDNKNMKGCYNQGVLLSFGKGVKQNHFEATKLY